MAYATYTTEAIVCGSKDSNIADRSYLLLTKHAGMLWASARSVREEKSKQRQALQEFSHVRVSLVRGKSGWRVGSVEAEGNYFLKARSRSERAFVQFVIRSLRRFLHGEEPVPSVYEDAKLILTVTERIKDFDRAIELWQLRLCNQLGYISRRPSFAALLDGTIDGHLNDTVSKEGLRAIEQALSASHL